VDSKSFQFPDNDGFGRGPKTSQKYIILSKTAYRGFFLHAGSKTTNARKIKV